MRTIFLFRHGEPAFPEGVHVCLGIKPDLALSQRGVLSAEAWTGFLRKNGVTAVFASPALRCRQTAEALAGSHWPVGIAEDLHEMSYGEWEGMNFDEIRAKYADLYARRGNDMSLVPPGGETVDAAGVRGIAAILGILNETQGNLAIVAHAGVNRALLWRLSGLPQSEIGRFHQDYAHVNILQFQDGTLTVDAVNQSIDAV